MELGDDDSEPVEHIGRRAEEHAPFVALDVDLEQQVPSSIGFGGRHPFVECDCCVVGYRPDETGDEVESIVVELRSFDRSIGEMGSHPEFHAIHLESGELTDARGEACGDHIEVIGQ